MKTDGKKIAKNTVFLYFRMLLVLAVTLYTSRIVLQVRGVDAYGVYQTVGGVVGFLSMANRALSAGTSRFLTFEMGRNDAVQLRNVFSITVINHFFLALIIVIIAETLGLWFVKNHIPIPSERFDSAIFVYHITVEACFFLLTQAPYSAVIVAREKLRVSAYISIIEVLLKLGSVFLLQYIPYDKLRTYVLLVFFIQVLILSLYRIYCLKNFPESRFKLSFEKNKFVSILKFSSWNLVMQGSSALNNQGFVILTNMFFGPAIVAARSIALQVNSAANQFVNNFRLAANPQIVKLLANGDIHASHNLLLQSTKFTYFLMMVVSVPIIVGAELLLKIWLGQVPQYSVIFLQLVVVQSLFGTFDVSFHTALYAVGKLKEESIITPLLDLAFFGIGFFLFYIGFSPISLSIIAIIQFFVLGCIVKPILICKIASYSYREVVTGVLESVKASLVPVSYVVLCLLNTDTGYGIISLEMFGGVIAVVLSCYFWGLDGTMREKVNLKIRLFWEKI